MFSWVFYLTFIFFTAFAFLNMVIGIVVSVLEKEQNAGREDQIEQNHDEIVHLREEIAELKALMLERLPETGKPS